MVILFRLSGSCRSGGCEKLGAHVSIFPAELAKAGVPTCETCGSDLEYAGTEIRQVTKTVYVHGGVAYAPSGRSNGVGIRVVDRDNH